MFQDGPVMESPFSDIEFIKIFQQLNKENLTSIPAPISPFAEEIPLNIATESTISEEDISSLHFLKQRLCKCTKKNQVNVILFNSPCNNDFCTQSIVQFSKLLAENGELRILLMDCNLRNPKLHTLLHASQQNGLSDYILGNKTIDEIISETRQANVSLITSGVVASNPINLLLSNRFMQLYAQLKTRFDFILVDSPPYHESVDTFVLAKYLLPIVLLVVKGDARDCKNVREIRNELTVLRVKIMS
ncbi:MAG: CpsD/CapB family tyrosine-protein kinase, partial [bacterium]